MALCATSLAPDTWNLVPDLGINPVCVVIQFSGIALPFRLRVGEGFFDLFTWNGLSYRHSKAAVGFLENQETGDRRQETVRAYSPKI